MLESNLLGYAIVIILFTIFWIIEDRVKGINCLDRYRVKKVGKFAYFSITYSISGIISGILSIIL